MTLIGLYITSLGSLRDDPKTFEGDDEEVARRPAQAQQQRRPVTLNIVNNNRSSLKLPANAWDDFYSAHKNNFFKDRHYLQLEHDRLRNSLAQPDATVRILDLGCGVGNSILPLLDSARARVEYLGVDVSPTAVEILEKTLRTDYVSTGRHFGIARVLDAVNCSEQDWATILDEFKSLTGSSGEDFDFCLMIFTVSAFPPDKMQVPIDRACRALKRGSGVVCFRDYLRGDLAEARFPSGQRLGRGLFVRQDGTLSFFFTPPGLQMLFEDSGLARTMWMKKVLRTVENRAYELRMERCWIGAEFVRTMI